MNIRCILLLASRSFFGFKVILAILAILSMMAAAPRVDAGESPVAANPADTAGVGGAPADHDMVAVGEPPAVAADGGDGDQPAPRSVRTIKGHVKGQDLRLAVHGGAVDRTRGGLKADDLMFAPGSTKVISKTKSHGTKQVYHSEGGSPFKKWNAALTQARHDLGFTGRFVPVGGQSAEGQRLLAAARALYNALQCDDAYPR